MIRVEQLTTKMLDRYVKNGPKQECFDGTCIACRVGKVVDDSLEIRLMATKMASGLKDGRSKAVDLLRDAFTLGFAYALEMETDATPQPVSNHSQQN